MIPNRQTPTSAFTLVEMSIVLAIIGIIVGAIFAGTSVLKQSELQTVIADYTKYAAATAQFNQLYGGQPGDLLDATNYWGKDAANCNSDPATATTPGTCNGDGNDRIYSNTENPRAWQHLQLAKLIDGSYTGLGSTPAPGTNAPRSRVSGAGWSFYNNTALVGNAHFYNQDLSNLLAFGTSVALSGLGAPNELTAGSAISPTEAWQIDKKMDDSLPATGRVLALKPGSNAMPNCTTSATDASASYSITSQQKVCGLLISLTTK